MRRLYTPMKVAPALLNPFPATKTKDSENPEVLATNLNITFSIQGIGAQGYYTVETSCFEVLL